MYEFPGFVYLDVQKTGSNFVIEFLRLHAREDAVTFERHTPVSAKEPNTFYFITCRDPLDQYLSLYSYGCAGRGRLRAKLSAEMYDGTPAGFSAWLRFTTDERNADTSREMKKYGRSGISGFAGFQMYRFLNLSFAAPRDVLAACRDADELRQAFRTRRIWSELLRNETLASSLASLARGALAPHLRDVDAAVAYLKDAPRVNASERVDRAEGFAVADADKRLIEEREWLFFEDLGYPRYTTGA